MHQPTVAAPPAVWATDMHRAKELENGLAAQQQLTGTKTINNEHISEAYRHVKQVVHDGNRRDFDLYDLLSSTRREETYQNYYQGVRNRQTSISCLIR